MSSPRPPSRELQIAFEQADVQHLTRQLHALEASGADVTFGNIREEDGGGIVLLSDTAYGPKLNRLMGLGLTSSSGSSAEVVNPTVFDQVEQLFLVAKAQPCVMIPDFVDTRVSAMLASKGYVHDGTVAVFYVDLSLPLAADLVLPGFTFARITSSQAEQFIDLSLAGFESGGRSPALLIKLAELALARDDTTIWFAYLDGQLAGSCGLAVLESQNGHRIAQLYIDSTLPEFRGRGLHRAMILERLRIAKEELGCECVILLARDGSGSARNAAAVGFHHAYDRPIWTK